MANVDLVGSQPITITPDPDTSTLTIASLDATETQKGTVQLATQPTEQS